MRGVPALLAACLLLLSTACRSHSENTARRATETPELAYADVAATPAINAVVAETATPTPEPTPTAEPSPTPEPPPPPPVAAPVRLRIPRIKVDARIVPVGVNYAGEMDSPKDAWSVAWYAPGFKPSEPGNAVLAGHVDYINVGPAVFWNVKNLVPGDRIFITASDNSEYEFEVKETERYPASQAPIQRIFGPNPNRGLNLITCTGTFNRATLEYDQRVVVYTELVVPKPPPRGLRDDFHS